MSYDPDADMAHGAKQQELLQRIDRALFMAADEKDIPSDALYREAALYLLLLLSGTLKGNETWQLDYKALVLTPIDAFCEEPTERLVLVYRVFEKMANGIGFSINHAYHAKMILSAA